MQQTMANTIALQHCVAAAVEQLLIVITCASAENEPTHMPNVYMPTDVAQLHAHFALRSFCSN